MNQIYSPEEDSYLLSKIIEEKIPSLLKKNPNLKFLEIGCGSGIQLENALKSGIKKENIFSCDINYLAVKHCRKIGFNSLVSNLFEKFKGGVSVSDFVWTKSYESVTKQGRELRGTLMPFKFNIIVFNPPYLPEDEREPKNSKLETTGGFKGGEIINKFLKQAKKHLNKNGKIFLVTSSLTKGIDFSGYKKRIISRKKLFFEELFVLKLERNNL